MTGTRNPSRKYFKRNQPYFYKSADNWEEWDTDESYDRTFFIGIDDSNPKDIDVALYMIWGGKPVAAVGSKALNTVSGMVDTAGQLETEIQYILKEVQELSAKVAQSAIDIEQAITEMNALVDRCEGILYCAEVWAEGTDAQVQALGGVHSSKGWAEQSTNANISLTNSPYTTNRILEIPQDIKLELNNGTLTLKAGSKVYVPNGFEADGVTPKFDVVTISFDINSTGLPAIPTFLYFNPTVYAVDFLNVANGFSGSTWTPTAYSVWYDTTNNLCKLFTTNTSTPDRNVSFPIAIFNGNGTQITSIDQVFNGFGYIGSTVFALPGVKVQTPNGRNADGTYKSVIRTVDSVRTCNAGAWGTRNLKLIVSGDTISTLYETQAVERFTYNKQFSSDATTYSYDENTGIWWCSPDQSSWVKSSLNILGSCRVESGKITQFQVDTVDSVANSNASNFSQAGRSYLSGLGMPSNRYIDLTLGASGATYTAPANGYFILTMSGATNGVHLSRLDSFGISYNPRGDGFWSGFLPARKSDTIVCYYSTGTSMSFRFFYAEGDQ